MNKTLDSYKHSWLLHSLHSVHTLSCHKWTFSTFDYSKEHYDMKTRRHLIIRTTHTTSREDDSCPHCGCRGRHITYVMCSDGIERGAMAGCIKKAFFTQGEFAKFERIERKYKEILAKSGRHWQNGLYELHRLENHIYDAAAKYNKAAGIDADLPERLYSWEQIRSKK